MSWRILRARIILVILIFFHLLQFALNSPYCLQVLVFLWLSFGDVLINRFNYRVVLLIFALLVLQVFDIVLRWVSSEDVDNISLLARLNFKSLTNLNSGCWLWKCTQILNLCVGLLCHVRLNLKSLLYLGDRALVWWTLFQRLILLTLTNFGCTFIIFLLLLILSWLRSICCRFGVNCLRYCPLTTWRGYDHFLDPFNCLKLFLWNSSWQR